MKDGQANVPVGLEKADEVPARLHSTAGVVLGGNLDLVGRERMPAVALAGNSDRRLSASPPGDGRSWEASSGGLGSIHDMDSPCSYGIGCARLKTVVVVQSQSKGSRDEVYSLRT